MYAIGIEEEYFVFDTELRRAVTRANKQLLCGAKKRLGGRVMTEISHFSLRPQGKRAELKEFVPVPAHSGRGLHIALKRAHIQRGEGVKMLTLIGKAAPGVFEPEVVSILVGAFDDAWASVLASGASFAEIAPATERERHWQNTSLAWLVSVSATGSILPTARCWNCHAQMRNPARHSLPRTEFYLT